MGAGGTILRTTNGGGTWAAQKSGTTQALNAVTFASATTGWAVGGRGTVLRTTNGGTTWTAQRSGTTWALYGVACADASTCWVVGNKGTVRHSTDGGATWIGQSAGTKSSLNAIGCSGASTAWIAGNGGLIRSTTNGGGTWASQKSGTTQTLRALTVIDASRVRVAGSYGTVRVTANGGGSWAAEATVTTQTLNGIAWRGGSGWVVGGGGTILADRPDTSAPVDHSDRSSGRRPQRLDQRGRDGDAVGHRRRERRRGGHVLHGRPRRHATYSARSPCPGGPPHRHLLVRRRAANAEAAKTGYVNIDPRRRPSRSDADAAWHRPTSPCT